MDSFPDPKLVGPGAFYVRGEDHLRLVTRNGAAGVTLTIEGRFLSVDGEVQPFVFTQTPTTDRVASVFDTGLGHGWILNVIARVTAGTPGVGQTFVQLRVIRGLGQATINLGTLAQGYVTETDDLAWPGAPIRVSVDGPGALREVAGANPAAGAEASISQTARTRWRPLAYTVTLVTDATAANREVQLQIALPSIAALVLPSGATQVASQTRAYTFIVNGVRGAGATSLNVIGAMPLMTTPGSTIFETVTTNLQAGDNFGAPAIFVEEWVED
jgi:hypothetical protein